MDQPAPPAPAAAEAREARDAPEDGRTRVDGVDVVGSLSPSRAGDFRTCPLLYRLRTIDRLPEQPSAAALRGTVVHRVLELLFDLPVPERTPRRAGAMVAAAWEEVRAQEPGAETLFTAPSGEAEAVAARAEPLDEQVWLESCRTSLAAYFDLEDPRRLEPAERESYVETVLDSRLLLRGIVDRLDVAADGAVRVVDYKTGRSPAPGAEGRALFQMRFYALVLWRSRGVLPAVLQLMYLADGQVLAYRPEVEDLLATERLVLALWEAVDRAHRTGEWLPNPGPACRWCSFTALCPEFGGTPPPLPAPSVPAVPAGPEGPGDASGEEAVQVGRGQAAQRLAPGTPLALGHRHVAGDDEDPAPGRLGRGRPGG